MPVESNHLVLVESATVLVQKGGEFQVTGEFPLRFVFDEPQDGTDFFGITLYENTDAERPPLAMPVGMARLTSGAYTVLYAIEQTWPEGARVTYSIWKERDAS